MLLRLFTPLWLAFACGLAFAQAPVAVPVVLAEDFSRADGVLHEAAGSAWRKWRGAPAVAVRGGRAIIPAGAGAEASVARDLDPLPAGATEVEAVFSLRVDPSADAPSGVVFPFQFGSEGNKRRGRLAVRVNADGSCQAGVTAKSANDVVWAAAELPRNEDNAVVLRHDFVAGRTLLWVNSPAVGAVPSALAEGGDAVAPGSVVLQQAGRVAGPEIRLGGITVRAFAGEGASSAGLAPAPVSAVRAEEPAITPPARGFRVFLLLGQSNMAGRGAVEDIDRAADSRILAWRPDGTWGPAREPLHRDKPAVAGVGPGFAFARSLLPALPPGESIGLVPAAFGGTRLAWWQKDYAGTQRWADGSTYYARALAGGRSVPPEALAGVLWIQGESDIKPSQGDGGAAYRRDLHAFIADLRADLGRPDLPFIAATLKPWNPAEADVINAIYLALPSEVPHTAVVRTQAPALAGRLNNKPDDTPHYDAPSARLLGELFAREARALVPGLR